MSSQGLAGLTCLLVDMVTSEDIVSEARCPAYEL